jgi:ATPase family associated with various cellular activities (AAA)
MIVMASDPIHELLNSDFSSDLVAALRERHPRLAVGAAALQSAMPLARWGRLRYRERNRYTIRVSANDELYELVREWVLTLLPEASRRILEVGSSWRRGEGGERAYHLSVQHDAADAVQVAYLGHRATVSVQNGTMPKESENVAWTPPMIVFVTGSEQARDVFLDAIRRINDARNDEDGVSRAPSVRILGGVAGWRSLDRLPPRPLESVTLADGVMEGLIEDLGTFLAAEGEYRRRGQPWHRGYLFSGPPGNGKSSTAAVLASHFGMDLYYFSLPDLRKDGDILSSLYEVGPRSIVVLEDADVFHAATGRDDDDDRGTVTLAGLLNGLDGIATPHGLVFILTSNREDALDRALIRPGRVDVRTRFDYCTEAQAAAIVGWWFQERLAPSEGARLADERTSAAAVISACRASKTAGDAWGLVFAEES